MSRYKSIVSGLQKMVDKLDAYVQKQEEKQAKIADEIVKKNQDMEYSKCEASGATKCASKIRDIIGE